MRALSWRSSAQCCGTCLSTSTNPMTASRSACSSSSTPAACIWSPPTPTRRNGAPLALSARATAEAWLSPDASPATKRISRTCSRTSRCSSGRETRQGAFDVGDDPEGDCQRFAPVGTGHGHRRLAADRREKALELEAERFALRGLERYALDECLQRLCGLRELREV